MKKLLILSLGCLIGSTAFAQTHHHYTKKEKSTTPVVKIETVPDSVKTAFQQKIMLADSTPVSWNKTADGDWMASYVNGTDSTRSEFTPDGQWVATRTSYTADNLPANISGIVKNNYADAIIKDGEKIQRSDVAAFYKVDIDENGMDKSLFLNDAGTITQ
jgi:Putative beta-lactamase-inhibitor-like, PepSY-like